MKQNVIIILLTAVAVLLLVNLVQYRMPPTAQAASDVEIAEYELACAQFFCVAVHPSGHASAFHVPQGESIPKGDYLGLIRSARKPHFGDIPIAPGQP
ncbi:MAG: hypothetical protein O7E56_11310 [SAR324 cluster bacterium]|nr:hypothetical protein [SAR324 cluster bacterium]MCZ6628803.1 hypothetical protein [SAR324 cluster bacterium]